MDPNEQEADQELMEAEEKEESAEELKVRGNTEADSKLEEADGMKEEAEQRKIDTESQIHEANAAKRPN